MTADLFGDKEEPVMPEKHPTDKASKAKHPKVATGKQKADKPLRFEEAYSRLEELVGEMERGELPLEELLAKFEEGVKLVKHCQSFLKEAQCRVEQYIEQKDGQWVLKQLDNEQSTHQ